MLVCSWKHFCLSLFGSNLSYFVTLSLMCQPFVCIVPWWPLLGHLSMFVIIVSYNFLKCFYKKKKKMEMCVILARDMMCSYTSHLYSIDNLILVFTWTTLVLSWCKRVNISFFRISPFQKFLSFFYLLSNVIPKEQKSLQKNTFHSKKLLGMAAVANPK